MHSHTLEVLGTNLSFKSKAEPRRIERARAMLEKRYAELELHGGQLSKERLLIFLALSLADDIMLLREEKEGYAKRIEGLLGNIEKNAG